MKLLIMSFVLYLLVSGVPTQTFASDSDNSNAMNFEVVSSEYRTGDCDATDSYCSWAKFSYPNFNDTTYRLCSDSINNWVFKIIHGCSMWEFIPDSTLPIDSVARIIAEEFETWQVEAKLDNGSELNRRELELFDEINLEVVYELDAIITIQYYEWVNTGGNHPNHFSGYFNFFKSSGKEVELIDILAPGYEDTLRTLGEVIFRNQENLTADANLRDAGYWFNEDKFHLNNNFAITSAGLLFHYTVYEIAGYADGVI